MTLRDALATALRQEAFNDPHLSWRCHYPDKGEQPCDLTEEADALAEHPAVAAWLRANDEALVALADDCVCLIETTDGTHYHDCAATAHADAIAAARERLGTLGLDKPGRDG